MQNTTTIIAIVLAAALLIAAPIVIINANNGGQVQMPESWASFFTEEEYQVFVENVKGYFTERGLKVTIEGDVLQVKGKGHHFQGDYGLANLAQECNQLPAAEWQGIISRHFAKIEEALKTDLALQEQAKSFQKIADSLLVRIWSEDYVSPEILANLVHQKDIEGTVTVLVYDLPTSAKNVSVAEAEKWGKTNEELFQIALANLQKHYPPYISSVDIDETIKIWSIETDEFYSTSYALLMHQYPELIGTYGTIVSIPNRYLVIAYPINNTDFFKVMETIIRATYGMHQEGPGSITSNVYWYHDGEYTNLPYQIDDKGMIHFFPPEEFTDVLNEISEAGV